VRAPFSGSIRGLALAPESGTWYRAIETGFLATALSTKHTKTTLSRFSGATPASPGYEILYFGENHLVTLLEVQALLGSPTALGSLFPSPHTSWTILNVAVSLQYVADLTDLSSQRRLEITAQELTGDWLGYHLRGPSTTVKGPAGLAPTQELGAALFTGSQAEGFKTLSAKAPYHEALVVFPEKLLPGSRISWFNPLTDTVESLP
jgi:RES domain-containing protein